jgi:hypothetical protein
MLSWIEENLPSSFYPVYRLRLADRQYVGRRARRCTPLEVLPLLFRPLSERLQSHAQTPYFVTIKAEQDYRYPLSSILLARPDRIP